MIASTVAANNVKSFGSSIAPVRIGASQISEKLMAAEAAIDAAIAAVATLTATIPTATQEASVGMHVTHAALMHAMESCQQLVKSRSNIIRSHKALRVAQADVGLAEVAFGSCDTPAASADQAQPFGYASVAA